MVGFWKCELTGFIGKGNKTAVGTGSTCNLYAQLDFQGNQQPGPRHPEPNIVVIMLQMVMKYFLAIKI